MKQAQDEVVDLVDNNDEIIGIVPRKGIHNTKRLHRSAHIFLVDPHDRIWLEHRAQKVDTYSGYYSSSVAGHIAHGESYLQGAQREVREELGISGLKLEQKHKLIASNRTSNEFVAFFIAQSARKPAKHEDTEELKAFSVEQIDAMIAKGEKFVPIFLILFQWYKEHIIVNS